MSFRRFVFGVYYYDINVLYFFSCLPEWPCVSVWQLENDKPFGKVLLNKIFPPTRQKFPAISALCLMSRRIQNQWSGVQLGIETHTLSKNLSLFHN